MAIDNARAESILQRWVDNGSELLATASDLGFGGLRDAVTFSAGSLHGTLIVQGCDADTARQIVERYYQAIERVFSQQPWRTRVPQPGTVN